jgi:hypothetical protein
MVARLLAYLAHCMVRYHSQLSLYSASKRRAYTDFLSVANFLISRASLGAKLPLCFYHRLMQTICMFQAAKVQAFNVEFFDKWAGLAVIHSNNSRSWLKIMEMKMTTCNLGTSLGAIYRRPNPPLVYPWLVPGDQHAAGRMTRFRGTQHMQAFPSSYAH